MRTGPGTVTVPPDGPRTDVLKPDDVPTWTPSSVSTTLCVVGRGTGRGGRGVKGWKSCRSAGTLYLGFGAGTYRAA